jgi:uncharacterized membrane protein YgaE (UPF0421/DUF939 family)
MRRRVEWAAGVQRLRDRGRSVALAAVAAGVAWFIATEVVGHTAPFIAPVAAITIIGLTVGSRLSRAVELTIGQALGILIADILVAVLGTGALVVALVSALAMTLALLFSRGTLVVQQAAVSAVLVATIQLPGSGLSTSRFIDALIGGAVAITFNTLIFPTNPMALVRRRAQPLLDAFGATVTAVADALRRGDPRASRAALDGARQLDELVGRFGAAARAAREAQRYAPIHRGTADAVGEQLVAAEHLDLAVRNLRVLARRAHRAVERRRRAGRHLRERRGGGARPPSGTGRGTAGLVSARRCAELVDDRADRTGALCGAGPSAGHRRQRG